MPSTHQPPAILAALAAREEELEDVTIRSVVIPNMGWFREDARKAWDLQVQYALAPDNREALADRLVDFHPFHMIQQHKAADFRPEEGRPIDVLMLVVSQPSESGLRLRWQCVLGCGHQRRSRGQGNRRNFARHPAHARRLMDSRLADRRLRDG